MWLSASDSMKAARCQNFAFLSTTLAIWRNTWTDGADLARHAREFIDAGLHGAQVAPTEA